MEEKKKLRCPMGVPGAVIAALIGIAGVVYTLKQGDWIAAAMFFGLFMMATPFIRFVLMVHDANDRLDELEKKLESKE
jgi:hypothetical protein